MPILTGKNSKPVKKSTSTPAAPKPVSPAPNEALKAAASKAGVRTDTLGTDEGHGALNVDALNALATKREVQQTTTERRRQTQERLTKHNDTLARYQNTSDDTGSYAPDPVLDAYDDLDGANNIKSDVERIRIRAEQDINAIQTKLSSIERAADSTTKMLISGIKQKYSGLISEMRDKNSRAVEVKRAVGIRQGRSRYTPEMETGIIAQAEVDGAYRIAELEGEMMQLVMEAETAREERELKIFNSAWDKIEAVKKTMRDEVKSLYQAVLDREKEQREREKAARDAANDAWKATLDASKRAAPSLARAMASLKDDAQRTALIETYATRMNIEPQILLGDIAEAMDEQQKRAMDLRNIEDQMQNRAAQLDISRANLAVSRQNAATSRERLALDRKKESFNPTADQRALVGRYLQSPRGRSELTGGVALTEEELQEVMRNQTLFYAVLEKAESAANL